MTPLSPACGRERGQRGSPRAGHRRASSAVASGACLQCIYGCRFMDMLSAAALPPARRRGPPPHPAAVAAERLNVSELTSILGLAQSGVSRHLGLLEESGLVEEQREGGYTYYRAARDRTPTASDRSGSSSPEQFAASPPTTPWCAPTRRGSPRSAGCGRRASSRTGARPPARARPLLGRVGAGARLPAAAAHRRRHRVRRRLPDDRDRALGAPRHRDRPLARGARRAPARSPRGATCATSPGSAARSRPCRSATPRSTSPCSHRRCTTPPSR
jgi:DNA-binding transcriptional ArsR family regulator